MLPVLIASAPDYTDISGWNAANVTERDRLRALLRLANDAKQAAGASALYLTSWLRADGVHNTGGAIDFAGATKDETLRMWVWLGQNKRAEFGELIFEQPKTGTTGHNHLTAPGFGGDGQILYQNPATGGFAEIDPFLFTYFRYSNRDRRPDGDSQPDTVFVNVVVGDLRFSGTLANST